MGRVHTWSNLFNAWKRETRCNLSISWRQWRHIAIGDDRKSGHLTDEQGWREWLGEGVPEAICEICRQDSLSEEGRATLHSASRTMTQAIRAAHEAPMLLTYYFLSSRPRKYRRPTTVAILPNGAKLVERHDRVENSAHVVTCFFSEESERMRIPRNRWKVTRFAEVKKYADEQSGRYVLPNTNSKIVVHEQSAQTTKHTRIQFVTPTAWGFEGDAPESAWLPREATYPTAD